MTQPQHALSTSPATSRRAWLRMAGKLLGRGPQIDRLIGSLQVDIGHTRQVLGWTPRLTVEQGLRLAVQDVMA